MQDILPPHVEIILCSPCGAETEHEVIRQQHGCIAKCRECGALQACPCTERDTQVRELTGLCLWMRP
ncbi:MAG: hypothetical protein ACM31L_13185 [Actinomycetota bacterium]